jgi:hypothetical protein
MRWFGGGFHHFTTPNGTAFSNTTTGTGLQTTFFWTFGDGSSSNDAQPFHTYAANGVYEACLQVVSIFELPGGGVITCVDDTCNDRHDRRTQPMRRSRCRVLCIFCWVGSQFRQ